MGIWAAGPISVLRCLYPNRGEKKARGRSNRGVALTNPGSPPCLGYIAPTLASPSLEATSLLDWPLAREEHGRTRQEVAGMTRKPGQNPMARLRERRERKRREAAERLAKRTPAQHGPDRTGRGDQWQGPGGG